MPDKSNNSIYARSSGGMSIGEGKCFCQCCSIGISMNGISSLLGLVVNGKATIDLFDALWDGLSDDQRQELRTLAFDAGIALIRFKPVSLN